MKKHRLLTLLTSLMLSLSSCSYLDYDILTMFSQNKSDNPSLDENNREDNSSNNEIKDEDTNKEDNKEGTEPEKPEDP